MCSNIPFTVFVSFFDHPVVWDFHAPYTADKAFAWCTKILTLWIAPPLAGGSNSPLAGGFNNPSTGVCELHPLYGKLLLQNTHHPLKGVLFEEGLCFISGEEGDQRRAVELLILDA